MKTRLVYIAGKDPLTEIGGHSSYVRAHARAATRAGYEVHLFCAAPEPGDTETEYGVVHCLRSPLGFLRYKKNTGYRGNTIPFHSALLANGMLCFLNRLPGPHLIHGFALWNSAGVLAVKKLRQLGIPATVVTSSYTTRRHEALAMLAGINRIHGLKNRLSCHAELLWEKLVVGSHDRSANCGADRVLINYQSVKNIVEAQFGPGIHFHRISYCPETAFLRSTDTPVPPVSAGIQSLQPADAPLLMSVSRHDPRKGLDVFIRALALLRGKGIPFRASLVGTGSLESSHRKLVEELGLSDSVRIEGLVPDSFDFLRHADVFVLPSLEEGSGSVSLLEALQVGVAVVASNTDGIPEDVSHGDSALLVEPGNAVNLAAALEQLLCNPELRHRMARRSMEIFEEKFSAATLTRALTAFYGSLGFPPDVNPHPSTASVGFQL